MAALAEFILEDEIEWRLVGLLHDLDYDETRDCIDSHGKVAAEALKGKLSDGGLRAIISHDHRSGVEPQTLLDESLIFADSLAVIIENRGLDILADTSSWHRALREESDSKPWISESILTYITQSEIPTSQILHKLRNALSQEPLPEK